MTAIPQAIRDRRRYEALTPAQRIEKRNNNRRWLADHPVVSRTRSGRAHQRRKVEVLLHYSPLGSKVPTCCRCSFTDLRALSLDHIDGDGWKERRARYGAQAGRPNWYSLIIRERFPEGYQTLCMNCQFIKRAERQEFGIPQRGRARVPDGTPVITGVLA